MRGIRVREREALRAILDPEVNVAIWERQLAPELEASVSAVAEAPGESTTTHAEVWPSKPGAIDPLLEPIEDDATRKALAEDVDGLIRFYAELVERKHVHAQLSVVTYDMCRRSPPSSPPWASARS